VVSTIFFWPVAACYIAAAFIMKPEPMLPIGNEDEREFYHSYTSSRTMALHRLKKTYDALDRRIQRIEGIVTSPGYDWDRRFND
jgi:phage shock protein C